MTYYNDYYDNTLMHYGVPGMKWGIRKAKAIGGFVKKMANPTERQAYAMAKKGAMKYKAFGAKKLLKNKAAAGAVSANMYKTMAKNTKAYKSASKAGRRALAVGKTGQLYGRHGVNAAKRGFGSAKGFAKKMANSTERQAYAMAKKGAMKYKAFGAKKLLKNKASGALTAAKGFASNNKRALAIGGGVAAGAAAAYGGYRAYQAYKAKRSKKGRR